VNGACSCWNKHGSLEGSKSKFVIKRLTDQAIYETQATHLISLSLIKDLKVMGR